MWSISGLNQQFDSKSSYARGVKSFIDIRNANCLILVPTFNCEAQIPRVLEKLATLDLGKNFQVMMIDNGSMDSTVDVIQQKYSELSSNLPTGTLFVNNENIGLGGSLKTGFLLAIENRFEFVVVLHGDDQANISDLFDYLSMNSEYFDLLVGSRFLKESNLVGYSRIRWLGNRALNLYGRALTQFKISDLIAGLNMYKVSALGEVNFLTYPDDLTFDAHFLLDSIHTNQKIKYFPISWIESDQTSNAKVVKQAIVILKLFTKFRFGITNYHLLKNPKEKYRNHIKLSLGRRV